MRRQLLYVSFGWRSSSPAMSTVGCLIFKCEKLKVFNQSFNTRYQPTWKTWNLPLFDSKKSLHCTFEMFDSCNVSHTYFFLLPFFFLRLQNTKVRRFAFELKMQDKSTYLLASDCEGEMEDWINTLNKILHSSFEIAMQEKRNGDIHDGACLSVGPKETQIWNGILFCVSQNIITSPWWEVIYIFFVHSIVKTSVV